MRPSGRVPTDRPLIVRETACNLPKCYDEKMLFENSKNEKNVDSSFLKIFENLLKIIFGQNFEFEIFLIFGLFREKKRLICRDHPVN